MTEESEESDVEQQYEELVSFIAERLLGTDDFEVTSTVKGNQLALDLATPEDLRGRVIGRGGRIARSIRTVLETAEIQTDLRPSLDIVD